MLVSVPEVKQQCRLPESHTAEDALLESLAKAAGDAAEGFLNRKLYPDQATLEADADVPAGAMVVTDGIKAGILLIVGDLYANREYSVTGTIISSFDRTLQHLWGPHRWYGEL